MAEQTPTFPSREPFLQGLPNIVAFRPLTWFRDLQSRILLSPAKLAIVTLAGQTAAIASKPFLVGTLGPGSYRVSVFTHVTTAAGVSSSLTPSIGFTHKGDSCARTGTALTTNTVTSVDSNTWFISIDGGTQINYAFAYASNPAAAMVWSADVVLESVNV